MLFDQLPHLVVIAPDSLGSPGSSLEETKRIQYKLKNLKYKLKTKFKFYHLPFDVRYHYWVVIDPHYPGLPLKEKKYIKIIIFVKNLLVFLLILIFKFTIK